MTVCADRCIAPRLDVPESVPVEHVCIVPSDKDHDTHVCSCKYEWKDDS